MFRIAFIIFRESLEIALLLSIISAVIQHFVGSRLYLIAGVMLGVMLASVFAFFAHKLSMSFYGTGDEIADATVILCTVFIIGWTIVWMQGYTSKIRSRMSSISASAELNTTSKIMLILAIASVILREGIEIILIIYGISSAEDVDIRTYMYGLGIGLSSGVMFGMLTYYSLIRLPQKRVFKISSFLLLLLAAGLASEAAGVLSSVGIILSFSDQLWDSSWLIDNASILGNILQATVGYQAKPRVIQVIFYVVTIVVITVLSKIKRNFNQHIKNNDQITD